MTERQKVRAYASRMEQINLNGKKALHKKWKDIASELSDRQITLSDICDLDSPKQLGLLEMAKNNNMSLGDLTMLRQYSEAIINGSTRAAEFIRDTMGEKPSTQVQIEETSSGLKKLSLEELIELRDMLKNMKETGEDVN